MTMTAFAALAGEIDMDAADRAKIEVEERQRADTKNRQARAAERIAALEAEAAANEPVKRTTSVERLSGRF